MTLTCAECGRAVEAEKVRPHRGEEYCEICEAAVYRAGHVGSAIETVAVFGEEVLAGGNKWLLAGLLRELRKYNEGR
jgi:hypothetical protein